MGLFTNEKGNKELESTSIGYDNPPQLQGVGTPYYQPTIMSSEKADLFDKIRPDVIVETLKYQLMGFSYNKNKQCWEKNPAMSKIALTELGATQIATFMLPVSSQNVAITKLNAQEISGRIQALMREVMRTCLRNWKEYGMITPAHFSLVKSVVLSNTLVTLKQPENAGVRQFIQGTTNEQRVISENQSSSGGLFGLIRR